MKRIRLVLLIVTSCFFVSLNSVSAQNIPHHVVAERNWDKIVIIRDLAPDAPEIYLTGDEISLVYSGDASELKVTLTSQTGEVVYESNYAGSFIVPNGEIGMSYTIRVEHEKYGYVQGEFTLK